MIKSFKITTYLGDSIELDIRKPEDTGFLISSVTGITLPAATISATDVATMDGAVYSGARLSKRNIVFAIIFYEDNNIYDPNTGERRRYDVEELRHKCYKYFPIKKEITIHITNDSGTYRISGYIESNESAVFTKQEGAAISVICPDPYFTKEETSSIQLQDVIGAFHFPVMFQPTQQFGMIKTYPATDINYDGAADTGLTIRIFAIGAITNLVINDLLKHEYMKLDSSKIQKKTGAGIIAKDEIRINTRRGKKSITLIRNGKNINILNCLDRNSKWLTLSNGANRFGFTADSGRLNAQVTFEYEPRYLGV